MATSDDEPERLREHPHDRFATPERLINLEEAFQQLLDEPREAIEGHRQITVAKRQGFSLLLFTFESGATLPDHEVDGEVTIHVLEGALTVQTDEHRHDVEAGELLILAPGMSHDVQARESSRMLLMIDLAERARDPETDRAGETS